MLNLLKGFGYLYVKKYVSVGFSTLLPNIPDQKSE